MRRHKHNYIRVDMGNDAVYTHYPGFKTILRTDMTENMEDVALEASLVKA